MLNLIQDNSSLVALAQSIGLHNIRCSLTGQVVASLSTDALARSIEFEVYTNPLASDDEIIDRLETRWMIQSSRPAPYLTAHTTKDGFKFLRSMYPKDLFAILAGRLLFEHANSERYDESLARRRAQMQWLIDLQDSPWFAEFDEQAIAILETLVRLDAMHNIRHCLYSHDVKTMASQLREADFNSDTFAEFVSEVENCGFLALATMKAPPIGNSMSMSAALAQHGIVPDQLINEMERQAKIEENRRRAIQSVSANMGAKNGKITVRRGVKAVLTLKDIGGAIQPELAAKYAHELEKRKPAAKGTESKDGKKAPSKASAKAQARFGNIDITF